MNARSSASVSVHRPCVGFPALFATPFSRLVIPLLMAVVATAALSQEGTYQKRRNYDARIEYNRALGKATARGEQVDAAEAVRRRIPSLAVTYDEDTGVTRSIRNPTGYLTERRSGEDPAQTALGYATSNHRLLGLRPDDLADYEITDVVRSRLSGSTHVYLQQRHRGIPVYNGQLQVHVARDGRILSVNNSCMPEIADAANILTPVIGPREAIGRAAQHLGIHLEGRPKVIGKKGGAQQASSLVHDGLSRKSIETRLMLLPVRRGEARLVWNFQIHTLDREHVYDVTVDAVSGMVWTRFDWVLAEQYRVYPQPVESPNHTDPLPPADGRVLLVDPQDPTASPQGWHDTGSQSYTITRGNNVHAYHDQDGNNAPPASETDCGVSRICDFPLDLTLDPTQYTDAAVANLFYWNNIVHDIQYQYGFDEQAGNFQVNNFGRGGQGGDEVLAEAQDGSGANNANIMVPPDGSSPRMQMFLWDLTFPRVDGDLDNGIIVHEYGHGISVRQVGGPATSSCLNNNQQPGEGWSDFFALVYTARPGDEAVTPRGIATYAVGEGPGGLGIRTQPYSTDPTVNDHTYESISGMAVPHGVGEVWAQALWEVYWSLVDQHGFDPDLYNVSAAAGNQRALLYVNEGLKMTACSPTFTDARDGIIQAAVDNFGGEDVCLLWGTFAAFGLGVDAVSGGPDSTNPTNGYQVPAECQCQPAPIADAGPDQVVCMGQSATLGTPAQPDHTYSWSPGGETTAQITVSPTVTTTYTLTATNTACGSAQDTVTVIVDTGEGGLRDDFESGAPGWTATGLWHLASDSQCAAPRPGYASPVNAFYYGQDGSCNYDTGAPNRGELTSPPISNINGDSTLSFDYYRVVEYFILGGADRTEVQIVTGTGATTVFAMDSTDASVLSWMNSGPISLAAFEGQTIQIRFVFDSVDELLNGFTGWFIDDVVVTGTSACVGNEAPVVTITAPNDGETFAEGTPIVFSGTAMDLEDGELTASLSWNSSLNGPIGTGGSFEAALSVGTHTITASVEDSGFRTGSDTVSITVRPNTSPTVSIGWPEQGSTFEEGTSVALAATATDFEDGDLTAFIRWISTRDGPIGTGGSFSTSTLSLGDHRISAYVADSFGLSSFQSVSITVVPQGGLPDAVDWNVTTTVAYTEQDGTGTIAVEEGGATLFIQGNRWRRTTETFEITPLTVLEFEFQSDQQGEIQGIGFDEDDSISNNKRLFQLYGTQTWGTAFQGFNDYPGDASFVTYKIPVGAFYTGSGFRLVLMSDKDSGPLTNTSRFRNVRVYEDAPLSYIADWKVTTTEGYPVQDSLGTLAVEDDGATFFLEGNRWRMTTDSVTITPYTVLEFEFQSTAQGELHLIGLDENVKASGQRFFQLFGTDSSNAIQDFNGRYVTLGTWVSYRIPIGEYFTGAGFQLVLANDQDSGPLTNTSRYRNIRIYDTVPEPPSPMEDILIDWNLTPTAPYPYQDGSGTIAIEDGGATIFLEGNRWRKTERTFVITPFTVLEFDFQSTSQGEVHAIGFDEDDNASNGKRNFQLFGTQTNAITAYRGEYTTLGTWVTYRIPVGAFYTGSGFHLVLVNDKDSGALDNTSRFRNVRIYENVPTADPLDFSSITTSPIPGQGNSGVTFVQDNGLTFFMEGNLARMSDQTFAITPDTLVAFDFQSTVKGEIHGLGFDEDDVLGNAKRLFKIFGTQRWSADIDWFRMYANGEMGTYVTFVIPVGRYYTGGGLRLILYNNKDSGELNNTSYFRNVRIYELN